MQTQTVTQLQAFKEESGLQAQQVPMIRLEVPAQALELEPAKDQELAKLALWGEHLQVKQALQD